MDLYDEFGNYIGPELDESDVDSDDEENLQRGRSRFDADDDDADEEDENGFHQNGRQLALRSEGNEGLMDVVMAEDENRIILHEDKKYYPDAEEVFPGVKTVVLDEDAQDLSEPIIKPVKQKNFSVLLKDIPELKYDNDYLTTLMHTPLLVRNLVIIGQLHHGKTLFIDSLVRATHINDWNPEKEVRYTDTRIDEQERQLSIKSTPLSIILEDLRDKSYLLNIIDCPGHINFADESIAAMRAADGVVLVVDAVEGVMMNTERLIKQAVLSRLPISLLINKVDRLILELKLPPQDAYFKLQHSIEEVNSLIRLYSNQYQQQPSSSSSSSLPPLQPYRVSPELGNVCFASAAHGWSFTVFSFAQIYGQRYTQSLTQSSNANNKKAIQSQLANFDYQEFGKRLWGDWYVNTRTNAMTRTKPSNKDSDNSNNVRTFVQFILEPLYKIYSHVLAGNIEQMTSIFQQLSIKMKKSEYYLNPKPLLSLSLQRFFGLPRGFVSMVVDHVPSPKQHASTKIETLYTGMIHANDKLIDGMKTCSSTTPFIGNVMKLYNTPDGNKFLALTRIYSGTVTVGQKIKVLGESYTEDDDEDIAITEITGIQVSVGRFSVEINSAIAGNIVLLSGIDHSIKKTATLIDYSLNNSNNNQQQSIAIFRPLKFDATSIVKLAVEPQIPSELPKMVEALRRINKTYPSVITKVEESGEHIILSSGELALDCIMYDLRKLFSDIEIKVSDPSVTFNETVIESSTLNCFSDTTNKKNRLTMLSEPLENGLSQDIEEQKIIIHNNTDIKGISNFFRTKYDWDLLTSRSIWAFGPDDHSPNILINNTIPTEVDQKLLFNIKDSIVQGFKWGTREGPLCDEPIRNTKFRILDATIAKEPINRGGGQIIPTARRTVYSSFLMATPRIMEPVYLVEIQSPADCVQSIYPVLARRRGHVVQDAPKPGAPFYTVKAFLPVMDSFGFETDLRSYTLGQAFCQQVFDHWAVVPGDPLDKNVILHPLEPSPPLALARDFMIKTRRRKGLSEDVSINKYLDDAMLLRLAKHEAEMGALMS